MPKIIHIIEPDGASEMKVEGIKGRGCMKVTEEHVAALRTTPSKDTKTGEYHAKVKLKEQERV